MDVSVFFVGLMLLCLGGFSMQFPQDLHAQNAATTKASNAANSSDQCATARGEPGSCVDRQYCDYSTYAIDLSLYAPKGYKKPCSESEACCPLSSQVQTEESTQRKPTIEDAEQSIADGDK